MKTRSKADVFPAETARLAALHSLGIVGTLPETAFDDIAMMAALSCDAPMALISFVEQDRQWFKASVGIALEETSLDVSFCAHAILQKGLFVVPDATCDPRFSCSTLVTGEPHLRFYAGAVIRTDDGLPLGTICVLDDKPRPRISDAQEKILEALARSVMQQLTLRQANKALNESEERYKALVDASATRVWRTDAVGSVIDLTNSKIIADYTPIKDGWMSIVHPEDAPASDAAWNRALETATPLDVVERKLAHDGSYRWTHVRAEPLKDSDGTVREWIGAVVDIHERVMSQKALQESEERFRLATRATNDAIWEWNKTRDNVTWGDGALALYGHESSCKGTTTTWWLDNLHPEDRQRVADEFSSFLASSDERWASEYRFCRADGSYAHVFDRAYVIRSEDGSPVRLVGAVQDISECRQAEAAIRASEERLRLALRATRMVAWEMDCETLMVTRSESAGELLGLGSSLSDDFIAGVVPEDRHKVLLLRNAAMETGSASAEVRFKAPDDRHIWISMRAEMATPNRMIGISFDITERKAAEEEIWRTANHDALTGLPNRALFLKFLDEALAEAEDRKTSVSLLLIDLDEFKDVNDTLGHDAGDALLKMTADRLKTISRDCGVVARIGGDEFAMILVAPMTLEHASRVADLVVDELSVPFEFEGRSLATRASIGIAAFPDHHREAAELMKDADIALYQAKSEGRGRAAVYSSAARETTDRRIRIAREVREALVGEQFIPFYQPKICLRTGRVVGFEALARWRHPERGILTPGYFGSAFADSDIAVAIGDTIIRSVAADIRSWLDQGLACGHVAVNFSSAEFADPYLAQHVLEILNDYDVPTSHFEIEITETVFLGRSIETTQNTLMRFHDSGVKIALDDFGTGFASLTHLKQFPIDHIKIDQSFVRDLVTSENDAAIVAAVIGLGQSLGIKVTAEGVETHGHVEHLRKMGCDQAQGFYYSRPMIASQVPWLIRSWNGFGSVAERERHDDQSMRAVKLVSGSA